jgi:hypothetical protein
VAQAQRSIGVAAPNAGLGVAVDEPALARALRQRGIRAGTETRAPASWGAWLRGAGLDGAIVGDQLIGIDDIGRDATGALEAARGGDTRALIALLTSA